MIKEIENHIYTDDKGSKRFLFELIPEDSEMKRTNEILSHLQVFKSELNRLPDNDVSKFYYIDGKVYLDNFNDENPMASYQFTRFNHGLLPFLKGENIYSNPIFGDDYVKINSTYFKFVSVTLDEDHFLDYTGLQKFGNYFICIKKIKTLFSKMMVNDARKLSHSSLYDALSDIEGIEAYRENEEMLRKIITREEELFKCDLFFVIDSVSEEEMRDKTELLITELVASGFTPKIETISLNNTFLSYTPGITPKLQKNLLFHTSLLANCLSISRSKLMDKGISFHARSGEEIYFDKMQADSYSKVITGLTGKGKTVFCQKLLKYELEQGRKAFVLDPKKDYEKFALLENAHFIDGSINPMIFSDPFYLRTMILSKVPKEERTALWEGKLLRAIKETSAHESKNFFKSLDLLKSKGFNDLEFYFEDIRDKISEKREMLSDLTYVNFESFSSESLPFLLSFAFEYVRRLNAPYNLVVDEAHRVFKHDPRFLEERVREMRVLNSSLITITQKYSDLISNYFGEVVADNSFHKFFFPQTIEEGKGGIDDFDKFKIESLVFNKGSFSEFYYKSDVHRKIVQYHPTLKELEVFGSDKEQTKRLLSYVKDNLKYFSVDECINQFVGLKYA